MRRKLMAVLFAALMATVLAAVASAGGPPIGSGGPNIQIQSGPIAQSLFGPPIGSG